MLRTERFDRAHALSPRPTPPIGARARRAAAAGGRDNSTLWLELVQCGLTFLLDVVLHSRERRGVKQWHEIFVGAFAYEPVAAQVSG